MGDVDELYGEAVKTVIENKRISTSLVQRKLRIGYNRAVRIIEEMERAGLVSKPDFRGARHLTPDTGEGR